MPTYAICPNKNCETVIVDYGTSQNIICPRCGLVFRSVSILSYDDGFMISKPYQNYEYRLPDKNNSDKTLQDKSDRNNIDCTKIECMDIENMKIEDTNIENTKIGEEIQKEDEKNSIHIQANIFDSISTFSKMGIIIKRIINFLSIFSIVLFLGIVTTNLFLMFYSSTLVIPGILEGTKSSPIFFVIPQIIVVASVQGYSMLAWYAFILAGITASFAFLYKTHLSSFFRKIAQSIKSISEPEENAIFDISKVFFASLFFSMSFAVLSQLLLYLGVLSNPPTTPPFESLEAWYLLYSFSVASFWEEVIVRVLFIGVPIALINFIRTKNLNSIMVIFGGKNQNLEFNALTIILIIFSSAIFGLAHFYNWDFLKIIPAFVSGLGFGYLYVKHGLHAAVVLHFAFDYMSAVTILFELPYYFTITISFILLLWLGVGLIYFLKYSYLCANYISNFFPKYFPKTKNLQK